MRKNILLLLLFIAGLAATAQNAVDFTCDDCSGASHHLFAELDSGAVIVICWVMPCGSCVGPTFTTNQVVKSFDSAYPGRVRMYLADDYANNTCSSINSWASGNNITGVTTFSNSIIRMLDYGSAGMPKVVVLGGRDHRVYYNANYSINASILQDSINAALNDYSTGTEDPVANLLYSVFPNPVSGDATLKVFLNQPGELTITIANPTGQIVLRQLLSDLTKGENRIRLYTSGLPQGVYTLRLTGKQMSGSLKMLISR